MADDDFRNYQQKLGGGYNLANTQPQPKVYIPCGTLKKTHNIKSQSQVRDPTSRTIQMIQPFNVENFEIFDFHREEIIHVTRSLLGWKSTQSNASISFKKLSYGPTKLLRKLSMSEEEYNLT